MWSSLFLLVYHCQSAREFSTSLNCKSIQEDNKRKRLRAPAIHIREYNAFDTTNRIIKPLNLQTAIVCTLREKKTKGIGQER
jgi:hypothetical protein